MSRTKKIARKGASKRAQNKKEEAVPDVPVAELVADAHALLAQGDFAKGIVLLEQAHSKEPQNHEVTELLGIAECEGGDLDKGRTLLLQLVPPHNSDPSPSTYLYLAQTAPSPQDALALYESAVKLLEVKVAAEEAQKDDAAMPDADEVKDGEDEDEQDVRKDCITALIAMIEIWMSDLCFEEEAPAQCDALISRALAISPDDVDAQLSLSSIRMSQSKPEEARAIVVKVAEEILTKVKEQGEPDDAEAAEPVAEVEEQGDDEEEEGILELPPLPTRHLLTRLLLEHGLYTYALRIIDTIRSEDELDVEGCYLEGWTWYCRGEALGSEEEANKVKQDAVENGDSDADELSREFCWIEALASMVECRSIHQGTEHPDEGILGHVEELIQGLEKSGITIDEAGDDAEAELGVEEQSGDVDVDMA